MSEKSDLRRTIRECNNLIAIIRQDIIDMENGITTISGYKQEFRDQKKDVDDYDMTVGGTWKQDLCDISLTHQTSVSTGVKSAKTTCGTAICELNTCINNAYEKIRQLEGTIERCERRIAEIEAAEEEERRRHNGG